MQQLYPLLFLCLAAGCAYLEWPRGKDAQKAAKPAAFLAFRNNYLFVYSCMMAGDWLQGPYVYALYAFYGYTQGEIGKLFIAGFGSSMIFGTVVGSLADTYGRKKACILYCITYSASCVTKHWNNYNVLMLGRFFGGIATSLLFSVFESWLVAEHNKRGYEGQWLGGTFTKAVFLGNGLVAILSGLVGNTLVDSFKMGPVAPFDAAICALMMGGVMISYSWSENYGQTLTAGGEIAKEEPGAPPTLPVLSFATLMSQFKAASNAIYSDPRVGLLGAIQSLFEASMYTFVFLWTPALSPNGEKIPHGMIFATFMVSCMMGSSFASRLLTRADVRPERYMQTVFLVSAVLLATPVVCALAMSGVLLAPRKDGGMTPAGWVQYLAFNGFECCVGLFWPSLMKMRSMYVPEHVRSTIMNMFRIPLNLFVCIILYNVSMFPIALMFAMCCSFLLMAYTAQRRLDLLTAKAAEGEQEMLPVSNKSESSAH